MESIKHLNMTSQIQINFINSISGLLYDKIIIDPSNYPILNIDILKDQIMNITESEYDICIFMHDLNIIQRSDNLYQYVIQNTININFIYDKIKKSQLLERLHNDYMCYTKDLYLSSKKKIKTIDTNLINLNSILYLSIEDIEYYDKNRVPRYVFRQYCRKMIFSYI
jgi:hypothetical protein